MSKISLEVVTSCEGCGGSCCRGMGGTPITAYLGCFPERAGLKRIPPALLAEMKATLKDWTTNNTWLPDDAPCVWLDLETGLCKHYEHRPSVCRDFPVGGDGCIRQRAAHGVGRKLRLVNGKLVSENT